MNLLSLWNKNGKNMAATATETIGHLSIASCTSPCFSAISINLRAGSSCGMVRMQLCRVIVSPNSPGDRNDNTSILYLFLPGSFLSPYRDDL